MSTTDELLVLLKRGVLSPEERAEVGLQLAELGDPRPGVGLADNGLPDIDWVTIPAGKFLLGSYLGDLTANVSEIPQITITLPSYQISRYPVTYTQYAAFIADGGYRVDAYWTRSGRRWRGRRTFPSCFWDDPEWHVDNHPVIGVNWYEALAFCAWLSNKLGFEVWLPRETEWEKAARGTDGRRFPWGNQFYAQYANCSQTVQIDRYNREAEFNSIGRTTAVGIYPEGASPYGVLDMCGNVWEWSATIWRENYEIPEDISSAGGFSRVVRGGGWNERELNSRTASRAGLPPETAANNLGFRICTSVEI